MLPRYVVQDLAVARSKGEQVVYAQGYVSECVGCGAGAAFNSGGCGHSERAQVRPMLSEVVWEPCVGVVRFDCAVGTT